MDYNISIYTLFYNISKCTDISSQKIKLHIENYKKFIYVLESYYKINEISKLIDLEPEIYDNIPQYIYVYIAGTIEILSKDMQIDVPSWIYKDYYFLSEPWFQEDIDKYILVKDIIIKTAPLPFKKRNMFISEQVISFL